MPEQPRRVLHEADLCVIGGGMAGICAAMAAARGGARVILMQDRPVLGGNASSECRVHVSGADVHNSNPNLRETGILEELRMENLRRNPNKNFSIWDTVLFNAVRYQPNLTVLLNCSCFDATTDGSRIVSVMGWQTTTYTRHEVEATLFADCSGYAILAPMVGADFRVGREARSEFNESIAPETADRKTMGMTCLFQSREYDSPQPFEPPSWAYTFPTCDDVPRGARGHRWWTMGYWWVELGGDYDSIHDTEMLRDELLKICYGMWDHIKNHCPCCDADNWALEWIQFLPAKRESRRYVGDHLLTQPDIQDNVAFADVVAYGGWPLDDHHPSGFWAVKSGDPPTRFFETPKPFRIPYRCLYSRNMDNLLFAGRNASCTHAAMSSTRVMGTGCSMGQAVGTAAALAVAKGVLPRALNDCIGEVQQALICDDAYLPGIRREMPALTRSATLTASGGDPEPVRDGIARPIGKDQHAWTGSPPGATLQYEWDEPQDVKEVSLVLDSALEKLVAMSLHQHDDQLTHVPESMTRAFTLEGRQGEDWHVLADVRDNYQRLVRMQVRGNCDAVRLTLNATWGAPTTRVFAFVVS